MQQCTLHCNFLNHNQFLYATSLFESQAIIALKCSATKIGNYWCCCCCWLFIGGMCCHCAFKYKKVLITIEFDLWNQIRYKMWEKRKTQTHTHINFKCGNRLAHTEFYAAVAFVWPIKYSILCIQMHYRHYWHIVHQILFMQCENICVFFFLLFSKGLTNINECYILRTIRK